MTTDEQVRADNAESFESLVRAMGYETIAQFESGTQTSIEELFGRQFLVVHDRIYVFVDKEAYLKIAALKTVYHSLITQ